MIPAEIEPEMMTAASYAAATVVGGFIALVGKRLQLAHEDRAARRRRNISQRDLWIKIGNMEQRIGRMDEELNAAHDQIIALRTENAQLHNSLQDLRDRYDRLRMSHDSLLRGVCPTPDEECPIRSQDLDGKTDAPAVVKNLP